MKPKKSNRTANILFATVMYILLILGILHTTAVLYANPKMDFMQALQTGIQNILKAPMNIFPPAPDSFTYVAMGTLFYVIAILYFVTDAERNKHMAHGIESGSAKWMTNMDKYNKQYSDPKGKKTYDGPKNMILSQEMRLNMDTRATFRNNNVLVVGGSGSGKSRFIVKPNLLQENCSFVVTDPSGELLTTIAPALEKAGYKIKVFNLVEMQHSNTYNPFKYIRDDLGVIMCINCLIKNTNAIRDAATRRF